jgi:predicted ribosome quality control (RQC) complex YloA/Tae2 family protein
MTIEVDVDEMLCNMTRREKREMYDELRTDRSVLSGEEYAAQKAKDAAEIEQDLMQKLEAKSLYELKKILCNLFNVPNYYDEQGLRTALETIIKA